MVSHFSVCGGRQVCPLSPVGALLGVVLAPSSPLQTQAVFRFLRVDVAPTPPRHFPHVFGVCVCVGVGVGSVCAPSGCVLVWVMRARLVVLSG